ncbi:MAG: DNA-binding domain-containing protein [Cellvibrionaceae bacterium]
MAERAKGNFHQGLSEFIRDANPAGLGALFQPGFDVAIAAIYRNGFYRNCREALVSTYGGVHHWLGDERFAALARGYIDQFPPERGTLTGYGANFPDWLHSQLDPSQGWLTDMARLDWTWLACLHGPDDTALTPRAIQSLAPSEELGNRPIGLLGNAQLIEVDNIVLVSWSEYKTGESNREAWPAIEDGAAQAVLMWRPKMEVYLRELSTSEWLFLKELNRQQNLSAASALVLRKVPDFDLAGLFAQLLENGVLMLNEETK